MASSSTSDSSRRNPGARAPRGRPRAALLAATLLAASSARAELPADRSLALVTIDTLRADRLSGYGYPAPLTPHLDRLARAGETYREVRTVAPLTLPAHASMMTGKLPREHGVRNNGSHRLAASMDTLAERLQARGYVTGAFVSSYVLHRSFGLAQGFDTFDDVAGVTSAVGPTLHSAARPGHATMERALAWLGARRSTPPFFLWVHLFEPHTPYEPPAPFSALGEYEGEVAAADHEVGRLRRALARRAGSVDVWVTADHGEALGEHGEPTHGTFLYDATLRVPLLSARGRAVPGGPPPGRIEGAPRSLAELPRLVEGEAGGAEEIVAESLSPHLDMGWSALHALVSGGHKLVLAPRPELYDLAADPGELRDIAAADAAQVRALRERLEPLADGGVDARAELAGPERAALESLGYLGGSAGGGRAARARGADPKDMVALLPLLGSDDAGLEAAIDALLARDPGSPLVRLRKAWLLLSTGRREAAEREFAALAAEGLQGSAPHQGLAACRSEARDWAGALRHFARAAERDPGDGTIAFNRGQILLFLGRAREAIPELERALSDESVGPDAAAALWQALARAPGAGSRWSVEGEVDPATLRAVARAAAGAGAAAVSSELEARAREVEGLDAAGLLARARRDPVRAEGYVARALAVAPDDPTVVAEAARRAEQAGDVERARRLRRRVAP